VEDGMKSKTLHLICNAHLDPVWLWEWEEGAGETLSTFRSAAQLCEEFDEFVFNHNEAVLYKWVEMFEPELFFRIQQLVKKKKWHILGGWYLQPDCNMPSGESFVRQILMGKSYFKQKFGVEPRTAMNFDPFGHTRGLVQILKKSGYSSYLFCRPDIKHITLPADDFVWVGYDGSEILSHRARYHYNSERGKARQRVEQWIEENQEHDQGMLLWGIGNHGGGASREDIEKLRELGEEKSGWDVRHGIPEDYFETLSRKKDEMPRHAQDLNPWAVGCYTTMALIKQKHRLLENTYYLTEKMVSHATLLGLMDYPRDEFHQSLEDLLFCEFHDILPGSSIAEVETFALQRMGHALEVLSRLKARAFFALASGEKKADEGEFPIFVYNPHPYPVNETISCEFQPQEPNFDPKTFLLPEVKDKNGKAVLHQLEKESSNISVDQRKRVVFRAELKPAQMNRFSCFLKEVKPIPERDERKGTPLTFLSDEVELAINEKTGWIDKYCVDGVDFLNPGSFRCLVIEDYPDPWGMKVRSFRNVLGSFKLMSNREAARFAGVSESGLDPVRIIEDGPVRTVVEALFRYNHSSICQRYMIPKKSSEFGVEVRVFWAEKDRMLKLSVPTSFQKGNCRGQVAYGVEEFTREEEELVAQKWVGVVSSDKNYALTIINKGTYGLDFSNGELRHSLLRSAAYAAHPVDGKRPIVPPDRFEPRVDQGERLFRFWINGGEAMERLSQVDREALIKNESPMALSWFPPGKGEKTLPSVSVSVDAVQVTSVKMAEKNNWLILRLFEPTGEERHTSVSVPCLNLYFEVKLQGFEIKTMAVDLDSKQIFEVDLMEKRM
jgi:alpha-mannosidase